MMLEIRVNYINYKGYRIGGYVFYLKHNSQCQLVNCIKRLACYHCPIEELSINCVLCTIDPIYLLMLTIQIVLLDAIQKYFSR